MRYSKSRRILYVCVILTYQRKHQKYYWISKYGIEKNESQSKPFFIQKPLCQENIYNFDQMLKLRYQTDYNNLIFGDDVKVLDWSDLEFKLAT